MRSYLLLVLFATASLGAFAKAPYLQNLTGSTVVVRWETRTLRTGRVQYGLTSAYGSEVEQAEASVYHELTLSGLVPDTVYHYRVVSGSDTSRDAAFRSRASTDRPFRFFVYGDNRSDSAAHQGVVNRMLAQSPLPGLAINVGDLTYGGSTAEYATFFNIEHSLLAHVPVYPALGNHDLSNLGNWFRNLALPNNERWYTFSYGNSVFHCIDCYSDFAPGSAQYDWLAAELEADAANPAVRHIFVYFHDPPYTTNTGHSGNMSVRTYLCPLFERFHVAIAFEGHVHAYEHGLVNGVHHVVSGGGGGPLSTGWGAPEPWSVYREATYQFTLVEVAGDTIRTCGIRPDGSEFDRVTLLPAGVGESAKYEVRRTSGGELITDLLNPTAGRVQFAFALSRPAHVSALLYDAAGRRVARLARGHFAAGYHAVSWAEERLKPGTYSLVVESDGSVDVQSMVVTGKN